jgi:adenylate cyclase
MNSIEDRTAFDSAIKEALRHYTRQDMLASSGLLSMHVLLRKPARSRDVEALRGLLVETTDKLFNNPRDIKIYRVLQLTYFDPAPKQEAAAGNLGLSFSTYRRYLAAGIARLTDFLWRLERENGKAEATATPPGAVQAEIRAWSLIVLPFLDLSSAGSPANLADSLAEGLIGRIASSLPECFVISRSTAFSYRGRCVPSKQIGEELRVRYLLEGSVLAASGFIRVNVHLIDAMTEEHLWADCFDKPTHDILTMQEDVLARLSRSVRIAMLRHQTKQGGALQARAHGGDEHLVLRGEALAIDIRQEDNAIKAAALFQRALVNDRRNIHAMAGLASIRVFQVLNRYGVQDGDPFLTQAEDLVSRAMAINPDHLGILQARAALMRARGQFEEAVVAIMVVLERHPAEPTACREMGLNKLYLGETAEAAVWFRHADRVAPNDPGRWTWLQALGRALMQSSKDQEAALALRLALDNNPAWSPGKALLAAAEALSGNLAYARRLLGDYHRREPGISVTQFMREHAPVPAASVSPTYNREVERIAEGLRLAGMAETGPHADKSWYGRELMDADCGFHLATE